MALMTRMTSPAIRLGIRVIRVIRGKFRGKLGGSLRITVAITDSAPVIFGM
jgi:hypothetical protein